jgi:hypothetical protein
MQLQTRRTTIQLFITGAGIVLPYLARIPGMFAKGPEWLTALFFDGLRAVVFFLLLNTICRGSIALPAGTYQDPRWAWFPVVPGFAFLALAYGSLDLTHSSTAVIALVFIPLYSLPFAFTGWLAGLYFDQKYRRRAVNSK